LESNLSIALQKILVDRNCSVYAAAQVVAAQTGEGFRTVNDRLSRWLKEPPKTWEDVTATLEALGYKVTIVPKDN
jgi:hypothetical protein